MELVWNDYIYKGGKEYLVSGQCFRSRDAGLVNCFQMDSTPYNICLLLYVSSHTFLKGVMTHTIYIIYLFN
jgi:hypothetical protein